MRRLLILGGVLATSATVAFMSCGREAGDPTGTGGGAQVEQRQSELTTNSWSFVGPTGFTEPNANPTIWSGTVLDVEYTANQLRLASSAGGLFAWNGTQWVPLSDSLGTADSLGPRFREGLALGAEATHPTNASIILVGTGDPGPSNFSAPTGSGIWRTIDSGANWTNVLPRLVTGDYVYHIEWDTTLVGTVHAVTSVGYFRSTDSGQTWSQTFGAPSGATDLVRASGDLTLFMAVPSQGIIRSTNGGQTWEATPVFSYSTSPVSMARLTINGNGSIVYGAFSGGPTGLLIKGSTTGGVAGSWTTVNFPAYGFQQCNRDIAIGTDTSGQKIVTGCDSIVESQDGGMTWRNVSANDTGSDGGVLPATFPHGDLHVVKFIPNTNIVLAGSDGGYHSSTDGGQTWNSNDNKIGIVNTTSFDVRVDSPTVFHGMSWDTADFRSTNGGSTWQGSALPEGGWAAVDPTMGSTWAWLVSNYGGNKLWRTSNGGTNWTESDQLNGQPLMPTSGPLFVRHDQVAHQPLMGNNGPQPGSYIYAHSAANGVLQSRDGGVSWQKYPSLSIPNFASPVQVFAVGRYTDATNQSAVYVTLGASASPVKVAVLDPKFSMMNYRDITAAFPPSFLSSNISVEASNIITDAAFAFRGTTIYRTVDRGATWNPVGATTKMPSNANIYDIIENPLNPSVWFAATDVGVYKSKDSGTNWILWSDGLPSGVPETWNIKGQTSGSTFQVFVGIWGRGIWQRDASADDYPTAWTNPFPNGSCALSLASGWVIGCNPDASGQGQAFRWSQGPGWILPDPNSSSRGLGITVDLNGTPWIWNAAGGISKFNWLTNRFVQFQPGSGFCATGVASGSSDTETWAIHCGDNLIYHWTGSAWVNVGTQTATKIAVVSSPDPTCGSYHLPWIMTPGAPGTFLKGTTSGSCASPTYSFASTGSTGYDLTTDYVLETDAKIYYYNGSILQGPIITTTYGTLSTIAGWGNGIYEAQAGQNDHMRFMAGHQ